MATCSEGAEDSPFFKTVLRRVRSILQEESVKLWEPPYTVKDESSSTGELKAGNLKDLIQSYSKKLAIDEGVIAIALEELRTHAIEKLATRKKFAESGVATLNIKISRHQDSDRRQIKIETRLDVQGADLKQLIKQRLNDNEISEIKIIFAGTVITDDKSLANHGIKNSSVLMAICLSKFDTEARECNPDSDLLSRDVADKRRLAQALAKRKGASKGKHERYFLEIRDQSGKKINMPTEEQEALSLAMTFHEMGRDLIKKKQYNEGLLLLLESDTEFRKCESKILEIIDNYGLLCLDIVWCYFKIQNLENLPDAARRLKNCKESLERSYGPNLERASFIESRTGDEMLSYVRLHLLEGILAFYQGQYRLSSTCFMKAEEEIQSLAVDDTKLSQVLSMGFSAAEGTRALRACKGDVTQAVDFITKKRQTQLDIKEKEREDRRKWKLSRELGKTTDGKWVDVDTYNTLQSMGISDEMACNALKHANNNLDQALDILQNNPELLNQQKRRKRSKKRAKSISDDLIQQVVAMGFEFEIANQALLRNKGNVQDSVEELLLYGGTLPEEFMNSETQESTQGQNDDDDNDDDYDQDYDDDSKSSNDNIEDNIEQEIARVMKDIGRDNNLDDDLSLDDEVKLINEYRTLLTALKE